MTELWSIVCLLSLFVLVVHITGSFVTLCILLCRKFFVWDTNEYKPFETKTLVFLSFCVGWFYTIDVTIHGIHESFSKFLTKRKMKEFINKLKTAFAVIKADKSVVFIDKDECVTRYVCGLSEEDIESLTDLDFLR